MALGEHGDYFWGFRVEKRRTRRVKEVVGVGLVLGPQGGT